MGHVLCRVGVVDAAELTKAEVAQWIAYRSPCISEPDMTAALKFVQVGVHIYTGALCT